MTKRNILGIFFSWQHLPPLTRFSQYFTNDFWKLTDEQTYLYSVQKKKKSIQTNVKEIKSFAVLHLVMECFFSNKAACIGPKKALAIVPL